MSNQASRFFVAASVLVLSLASFGGVQTNSVSAEVRTLQAKYEAEPLTYPEPPFAPVSRLLSPAYGSDYAYGGAGEILNYTVYPALMFLIFWAVFVLFREYKFLKSLDKPLCSREMSDRERELCRERLDRALSPEMMVGDDWHSFIDYNDVLYAQEQVRYCQQTGLSDPELIDKYNSLVKILRFSMERHYLLWESGGFGKSALVLGAIVAIGVAFFQPMGALLMGIPLALYALAGRTPMHVAVNPSRYDRILDRLVWMSAALCAAMLPGILSFEQVKWVNTRTNETVRTDTNWSGFGALVLAAIVGVASLILAFVRIGLLFLRNYVIYRSKCPLALSVAFPVVTLAAMFVSYRIVGDLGGCVIEFNLLIIILVVTVHALLSRRVNGVPRRENAVQITILVWAACLSLGFWLNHEYAVLREHHKAVGAVNHVQHERQAAIDKAKKTAQDARSKLEAIRSEPGGLRWSKLSTAMLEYLTPDDKDYLFKLLNASLAESHAKAVSLTDLRVNSEKASGWQDSRWKATIVFDTAIIGVTNITSCVTGGRGSRGEILACGENYAAGTPVEVAFSVPPLGPASLKGKYGDGYFATVLEAKIADDPGGRRRSSRTILTHRDSEFYRKVLEAGQLHSAIETEMRKDRPIMKGDAEAKARYERNVMRTKNLAYEADFLFAEHRGWLDTCPESFKLVVDSRGDKVQERKRQCRACKGTGKAGTRKNARPCKRCEGTGEETARGH